MWLVAAVTPGHRMFPCHRGFYWTVLLRMAETVSVPPKKCGGAGRALGGRERFALDPISG